MKYEYTWIYRSEYQSLEGWKRELDEMGAARWELVNVSPESEFANETAYFKRVKNEKKSPQKIRR